MFLKLASLTAVMFFVPLKRTENWEKVTSVLTLPFTERCFESRHIAIMEHIEGVFVLSSLGLGRSATGCFCPEKEETNNSKSSAPTFLRLDPLLKRKRRDSYVWHSSQTTCRRSYASENAKKSGGPRRFQYLASGRSFNFKKTLSYLDAFQRKLAVRTTDRQHTLTEKELLLQTVHD